MSESAHHAHREQHGTATLYRTPRDAMDAPVEKLAYVALLDADAMAVVDVDPTSNSYGSVVGQWDAPPQDPPDEFHHYGWNICSSALGGDHDHDGAMERRYLVVPGIRSSRIYVLDTGPDPRQPSLVRTIEPEEVMGEGHYSRPIDDVEESARPTTVPASSAKRNRRPLRVGCGAEPPWRRPRQPPTPQAACDGRFGSRRADRCTDCQPRRSSRSRDLPGAGSEATEANPHGR